MTNAIDLYAKFISEQLRGTISESDDQEGHKENFHYLKGEAEHAKNRKADDNHYSSEGDRGGHQYAMKHGGKYGTVDGVTAKHSKEHIQKNIEKSNPQFSKDEAAKSAAVIHKHQQTYHSET